MNVPISMAAPDPVLLVHDTAEALDDRCPLLLFSLVLPRPWQTLALISETESLAKIHSELVAGPSTMALVPVFARS